MTTHVIIIGIVLLVLAFIHLPFPKYFKWKEECSGMSMINRQMMYIHTLFIALTVFLMGLLCVSSASELVTTGFGKRICLGMAIFWLTRLIIQFFGYSSVLWRGKRFETGMHILFSFLWVYFTVVFVVVAWG